jgi:arylsulfatase B
MNLQKLSLHVVLVSLWLVTEAATAASPNILLIVADDLGYADVGFNGGKVVATPNLDRLAVSGVNLTNFRVCPMCSPTRAGTLTGRWPIRFGMMRAVVPPWSDYGLPASEQTLPELLESAGYESRACIGKWHLGHTYETQSPLAHGFTSFYGHYNGAIDYFTHLREGEVDWHRDRETIREEGYSTDLLGAEAARLIDSAPAGKPWFVYLPFNAPHGPFQAKEEELAKYPQFKLADRRAYAAMIDSLDQAIGRVLSAAESRPDADNTLVLFYSDNGGIPKHGSSNAPWRGAKLDVYEGGTRVAAAVRWPAGGLRGGTQFDGRIGYIDVLPTLLAAAGREPPQSIDGINVLPALRGEQPLPERSWFSYIHQSGEAQASVHDGRWKLVAHGDFFSAAPSTPPQLELYDLQDDPAEEHNVAASHPEIVSRLHARLREFGAQQRPGIGPYNEGKEGFTAPRDWVLKPAR